MSEKPTHVYIVKLRHPFSSSRNVSDPQWLLDSAWSIAQHAYERLAHILGVQIGDDLMFPRELRSKNWHARVERLELDSTSMQRDEL